MARKKKRSEGEGQRGRQESKTDGTMKGIVGVKQTAKNICEGLVFRGYRDKKSMCKT